MCATVQNKKDAAFTCTKKKPFASGEGEQGGGVREVAEHSSFRCARYEKQATTDNKKKKSRLNTVARSSKSKAL